MKTIVDKIYGKVKINEPILIELLQSPSILRLKDISQYGIPDKYYHHENYSRYEHSVGVMFLLRKLGATLEEQVAGLLHDVSVLTFSHVADWVFSRGAEGFEDFHDSVHGDFVKQTEIPKILESFHFSVERILNEENFPLLEKKIPDLRADRVDYALREFKYWLNPKIVNNCLNALANFNGEIVFVSRKAAFKFATNFLELQSQHWGGYEATARYHLFSQALQIALKERIIIREDFSKKEVVVLRKIEKTQNKEVREILTILRKKEIKNFKCRLGRKVIKKFRWVDPKVVVNGELVKLSEIQTRFQKLVHKHREINRQGLIV